MKISGLKIHPLQQFVYALSADNKSHNNQKALARKSCGCFFKTAVIGVKTVNYLKTPLISMLSPQLWACVGAKIQL